MPCIVRLPPGAEGASDFRGTLAYAAPELLLAAPCTNKIGGFGLVGFGRPSIAQHAQQRCGPCDTLVTTANAMLYLTQA